MKAKGYRSYPICQKEKHNWVCSETPAIFVCKKCKKAKVYDYTTQSYEIMRIPLKQASDL